MRRIRSLTQTTCTGLAIVFVAVVLRHGVEATSTLDWPHDPDHLRDIAHAQNIAEGRLLDDPYLAGEWAWYNPLVPAITAGVATLTGQPVPVVHARFYAFLNVTAPLAFFLLLAVIAGPRAAVIGLSLYLFVVEDETWMWGTYSPHPFAANFAQAPFFLTLAAWWAGARYPSALSQVATGVLLGVTALAHTTPAVLAGGVIVIDALSRAWPSRRFELSPDVWRPLRGMFIVGATAVIVALPLLIPIAGHYGLIIQNPVPLTWIDRRMELQHWRAFTLELLGQWRINLPMLAGIAWLAAGRGSRRARIVLTALFVLATGCCVYTAWVVEWFRDRGIDLPYVVPAHHFLLYARVTQAMLGGVGLAWLVSLVGSTSIRPRERRHLPAVRAAVLGATLSVAAGIAVVQFPSFERRNDFHYHADIARTKFSAAQLQLYTWARGTPASTVVLTSDRVGGSIIGPAGRKVVAVEPFFSNPYVSHARLQARSAMWQALATGDCYAFDRLAGQYRVTHVVTQPGSTDAIAAGTCGLVPRLQAGDMRVFQRPVR